MTTAAATALGVRITNDEGFRDLLTAAPDAAARLQLAREAGYELTLDELPPLGNQPGIEQLSDDQLETVAGGVVSLLNSINGITVNGARYN